MVGARDGPYTPPIETDDLADDPPREHADRSEIPPHRYSVGMRTGYDLMSGVQFSLLFALGLREHHKLCDVGCGSLRVGRLLIPYLAPGNYHGIEPREWVVQEGIANEVGADLVALRRPRFDHGDDFGLSRFGTAFDYVLAQSVFSHTYRDLTVPALANISAALAPGGLFVGTLIEEFPIFLPRGVNDRPDDGSGFQHQGGVVHTWREWTRLLDDADLVARRVRWFHLRQTWFVAAHKGNEARLAEARRGIDARLRGPGAIGHARRRALARFRRR